MSAARRILFCALAAFAATVPAAAAANPEVAALQAALRANGFDPGAVDGVTGPGTRAALQRFQAARGLAADGVAGPATRAALGELGRPRLGNRVLAPGRVGWDVSVLEFRLVAHGLAPGKVDGRFDAATAAALRRFQAARGLDADGIAGRRTLTAITRVPRRLVPRGTGVRRVEPAQAAAAAAHVVQPGESFSSIALRYGTSAASLAGANGLGLGAVIVPGQRLVLPAGAALPAGGSGAPAAPPAAPGTAAVAASLDRWSAAYGVDPALARALAWVESGWQNHVVSPAGARGVMQLLPGTWDFVETVLLGQRVPDTYDGNVRIGVRHLRWLLDEFGGDRRLAVAGYYQGARAVRERGLFDDTKVYVRAVLAFVGKI